MFPLIIVCLDILSQFDLIKIMIINRNPKIDEVFSKWKHEAYQVKSYKHTAES